MTDDRYLAYMGLADFRAHVDEVTSEGLSVLFDSMWSARAQLRERIAEQADLMRQHAARNVDVVAELIGR